MSVVRALAGSALLLSRACCAEDLALPPQQLRSRCSPFPVCTGGKASFHFFMHVSLHSSLSEVTYRIQIQRKWGRGRWKTKNKKQPYGSLTALFLLFGQLADGYFSESLGYCFLFCPELLVVIIERKRHFSELIPSWLTVLFLNGI